MLFPARAMASNSEANLAAALALAQAGIKIFPAGADKRPLFKAWQGIATIDIDVITDWWSRAPYALPAVPCGVNNFLVVDCDRHPGGADGVRAFKQLVETHGGLPPCPMVRSTSISSSRKVGLLAMAAVRCLQASISEV
jgi:Bifunctional DNA primase/polymerase, N-terminal